MEDRRCTWERHSCGYGGWEEACLWRLLQSIRSGGDQNLNFSVHCCGGCAWQKDVQVAKRDRIPVVKP